MQRMLKARRRIVRWATLVVVVALLACAADVASACPTCKNAVAGSEGGGDVVAGYFWSILFMMSMPFTILGTFSGYMYLEVRKARARQAAEAQAATDAALQRDHDRAELIQV